MILDNDVSEILVSEEDIRKMCERLGKRITEDYQGKDLVVVGLLNGCNPFIGDLIQFVDLKLVVDYMRVSSYHGTIKSSNEVKIVKDLEQSLVGKDVLVIDDIIDTGQTLKHIVNFLKLKGARTIEACVLLDKAEARTTDYNAKYIGVRIKNKFVVGYGLDYNDYYRNLPYIGVLDEKVYKK